jgi:hypothetical protein
MNTAAGGRYIAFAGGLPLWDGDRVIGGVGVSGGTGQQAPTCAQAAHEVYARGTLHKHRPRPAGHSDAPTPPPCRRHQAGKSHNMGQ